jgi:Flp pilus assembly protein TadB
MAAERGCTHGLDKALRKITESVPLPLVTILVCFHPERAGLDLKQVLEKTGQMRSERMKARRGKKGAKDSGAKIAVIG